MLRARRYVYQKAYVEFFTSPENFRALEPKLKAAPSITYMAVNAKGDMISNLGPTDVNAVTWGVFPAKEIIQPTVVDPQSFAVWKVHALHVQAMCMHACIRAGLLARCNPHRDPRCWRHTVLSVAYQS